jgi:exosortase C (VPDSG-CTERM-specific)
MKTLIVAGILLLALFGRDLVHLFQSSWGDELESYIPLIPFISAYFVWKEWKNLSPARNGGVGISVGIAALGVIAFFLSTSAGGQGWLPDGEDRFCLRILSMVCFVDALGIYLLGVDNIRKLVFSMGFLLFMIPLPGAFKAFLMTFLQHTSADVAYLFLKMTGTPIFRDGLVFQLPRIKLLVAPECSGIHSSLVLFITSFVAGQMLIHKTWRKVVLVALVIPLGIVRNGFRILVLGWVSSNIDPNFINSPLHHRGGPVFFVISLIPFFLLLYYFRRAERPAVAAVNAGTKPASHLVH